jgi:hypothetical protein
MPVTHGVASSSLVQTAPLRKKQTHASLEAHKTPIWLWE